jgi:hypothetical protein
MSLHQFRVIEYDPLWHDNIARALETRVPEGNITITSSPGPKGDKPQDKKTAMVGRACSWWHLADFLSGKLTSAISISNSAQPNLPHKPKLRNNHPNDASLAQPAQTKK